MDNSKQTDEGIEIELDISDFGEEEIEEVAADEIVTKEIEEKTELDLEQVLEEKMPSSESMTLKVNKAHKRLS